MRKLALVAAVFYGAYWYVSHHFKFEDTLAYAHKNPQKSWAPAADYYVGLAYYQQGEYAKSQEAFTQLLTDYATGPYNARALLRLSEVAGQNRDWPVARQSLERFIEEFPNHKEISVAQQRLEVIKFK